MNLSALVTDKYNRRARLQPALLAILPLFAVALIMFPGLETRAAPLLGVIVSFGGLIWLTQLGRERGKSLERELYRSWGGKPSVVFLRHGDKTLSGPTKKRYHAFLEKHVAHFKSPSPVEEERNPVAADEMYQSATDWLLAKTRDTAVFHLIFEENMNYGFRRNLWAIKPHIIVLDAVLFFVVIGSEIFAHGAARTLANATDATWISLGVAALHLFWVVLVVTRRWVRTTAEAYAVQLLAACDRLEVPSASKVPT